MCKIDVQCYNSSYHQGTFAGAHHPWHVAVAEVGMGGTVAAVEAEKAIQFFHPQIALFVGQEKCQNSNSSLPPFPAPDSTISISIVRPVVFSSAEDGCDAVIPERRHDERRWRGDADLCSPPGQS